MNTYDPGTFAELYSSEFGQELWMFLNEGEIISRMETASDLGRPAVQGIEDKLLDKFGAPILEDRAKQMTGHMVRQIMEYRGWVLAQSNVGIQSVPFASGTRYERSDALELYAFRNAHDPRDVAIAATRRTGTLPGDGKWTYAALIDTKLKAAIGFGLSDVKQVQEHIRRSGYYRLRVERMMRAK